MKIVNFELGKSVNDKDNMAICRERGTKENKWSFYLYQSYRSCIEFAHRSTLHTYQKACNELVSKFMSERAN